MRFEQIIVAVTRNLVIATVREIEAVVSFANAMRLHLWLLRTNLGMPSYSGSDTSTPAGAGRLKPGIFGCKRGRTQSQPWLVTAGCPAGYPSA